MDRARRSIEGLSVGDAFGERFFGPARAILARLESRELPAPPWRYTDDTVMALGILEVLERHGAINQDDLALTFARRYRAAPGRGYGRGARDILDSIAEDTPWAEAARQAFDGKGSMGNGGAMRVAPVGAYFADDLDALVRNAQASAEVTHAHPEGQAGAVAVAAAAAFAWRSRELPASADGLLGFVLDHTPAGETRDGIAVARALAPETTVPEAAATLGSGIKITSQDTVPFSLWCAARNLRDYAKGLWEGVAGLGDIDTVCAIIGGIVVLSAPRESMPADWLAAREALDRDP
jgi:ADP-ribosylglycohydrolase